MSLSQSVSQSVSSQSVSQFVSQSVSQPAMQSVGRSVRPSVGWSVSQSVSQSVNTSLKKNTTIISSFVKGVILLREGVRGTHFSTYLAPSRWFALVPVGACWENGVSRAEPLNPAGGSGEALLDAPAHDTIKVPDVA